MVNYCQTLGKNVCKRVRNLKDKRRKNNPDWTKIDKMISEREALEDKYRDKELKFETNYAKKQKMIKRPGK